MKHCLTRVFSTSVVLFFLSCGQTMANSCGNPTGSNSIGDAAFGTDPCTLETGGSATVSGAVTYTGGDGAFKVNGTATGFTIDSSGSVTAGGARAFRIIDATAIINGDITNNGTITGGGHGIEITSNATLGGSIINSGTISATGSYGDSSAITISDSNNPGTGVTGDLINETGGLITSAVYGVYLRDDGKLRGSLINNGTISGDTWGVYVNSSAYITTLTNQGTITNGINVDATASITTLNNAQNNLAYTGKLPTNYNTIIDGSNYGKLVVSSASGTTDFGIYSTSSVSPGTYTNVLSGVTAGNLGTTSGSFGAYNWTLNNSSGNLWDLVFSGTVGGSALSQENGVGLPAATVIDQNGNLLALFSAQTTAAQQSAAVTQTLPLLTGGTPLIVENSLSNMSRVIQARLATSQGMSSGNGFVLNDRHLWLKPIKSWARQDDRNGVSGFDADTWGVIGGVDTVFSNDWRLGLAFGYANTDVDSNSSVAPQSSDIDVYQLIGYGSKNISEDTEVNFQIVSGKNKNDGKRTIAFTNTVADSSFDGDTFNVGLGASRHIGLGNSHYSIGAANDVIASVRADYSRIRNDSYTETGAGLLNLTVDRQTTEAMVLSVEGKLIHEIDAKSDFIAKLGVGYDTINEKASITAAFAGAPTAAFVTDGINPDPWIAHAGLGYTHQVSDITSFTANYDAEYREDFLSQAASVNIRWAF